MPTMIFRKLPQSLRPIEAAGEAWLAKVVLGAEIKMTAVRNRSGPQNRKFWKLMHTVHGTLADDVARIYPTPEKLVDAVKIYLGVRDEIYAPNGDIIGVRPGSIAYDKMPQDEFNDFMDRVMKLIAERFLPGVADADLRRELQDMVA